MEDHHCCRCRDLEVEDRHSAFAEILKWGSDTAAADETLRGKVATTAVARPRGGRLHCRQALRWRITTAESSRWATAAAAAAETLR